MKDASAILGSVLGCALLLGCHNGGGSAGSPTRDKQTASVAIATADKGDVEDTIETYGKVEFAADQQRSVSFVRPGQVLAVSVVEGQLVKKSAELLRVGAVPRGSPEVQQARIAADFAEREITRVNRLVREKLATNQELQTAQNQLATANSTLGSLGGGGAAKDGAIRAAMDGIVAKVLVHRGDVVQVGQTGIMLAPRDSMSIRVGFEVEDLPKLSEGLAVRITSVYRGEADQVADAILSSLHRVVDARTQLVEGVIHVSEPPAWMAPGLSVRVVVVVASHANVVRVPREALVPQDGSMGVFVVAHGHASWRVLKLGFGGTEEVEVVSGVHDGESVATTGRTSLSDGMAVRLVAAGKP